MTIDFASLENSLSLLPAHELLGIEEELLPSSAKSAGFVPQAAREDKQQTQSSTAERTKTATANISEEKRGLLEETEARALVQGSSQLLNYNSEAVGSDTPLSNLDANAPITADADFPDTAAETDAADKDFEELMLSAAPEKQSDTHITGSRLERAANLQTAPRSSQVISSGTQMGGIVPETAQPAVEDLESWLDSL